MGLLVALTVRFTLATSWTVDTVIVAVAALVALLARVDVLWIVLGAGLLSLLTLR